MPRMTRIQDELRRIDPGTFQQLCDELLYAMEYRAATQTGMAIGANKVVRGTPDTRFVSPDGRYVFAEYTTQQTGVFEKLQQDVHKCFDRSHAGVPASAVGEVVLCHTSKLDAADETTLRSEITSQGAKATILGLSSLALELLQNHPRIARDYLGIAIDTGQILVPADFIRTYQRNALATPIDTAFHFRKDDLEAALASLRTSEILVVGGHAGVGKTRFALETAKMYAEAQPGVAVSCLYNHGVEMFEDLRTHYAGPGRHLVVVDDANRLGGFASILSVLRSIGSAIELKIIATVRDYASKRILSAAGEFGTTAEIKLQPLTTAEVRDLVRSTNDITDHVLLDRIATLARGNPRLAMMAARSARNKESFIHIHDASALYEAYFGSVARDLEVLGDPDLLKAAGVVALFRTVDRRNRPLMEAIELGFGLSDAALWERVLELHKREIIDLYENEVAKTSDQVLATYLMYLCFFKLGALPFEAVLAHFFPKFRERIMDALQPIAQAFTGSDVLAKVRRALDVARTEAIANADESKVIHLVDAFALVDTTRALQFAKAQIEAMPDALEVPRDFGKIEADSNFARPSIPSILQSFASAEMDEVHNAIELLLRYVEKAPDQVGVVAHVLDEDFGIDTRSYRGNYERETAVAEALILRMRGGASPLFARAFLHVASHYLQVEFVKTRAEGRHNLSMNRFVTPCTSALVSLRATLWKALFSLVRDARYEAEVLEILREQRGAAFLGGEREVLAADADLLESLLVEHLDAGVYSHCVVVRDYLGARERAKVPAAGVLRATFCANETLVLAEILSGHRFDRSGLSWQEQEEAWRRRIHVHVADFDLDGYERLLARVPEILRCGERQGLGFRLQGGVIEALLHAARSTPELFVEIISRVIAGGNAAAVEPWSLAGELVRILGSEAALRLVTSGSYTLKWSWTYAVLLSVPRGDEQPNHAELLCELYRDGPSAELPFDIRLVQRFDDASPGILPRILRILLERAKEEPGCIAGTRCLFMSFDDDAARVLGRIANAERCLTVDAYFAYVALDAHGDFNGRVLDFLIDRVPDVLDHLAEFAVVEAQEAYWSGRSYLSIWRRPDYAVTVRRLVLTTFDKLASADAAWATLPRGLFMEREDEEFADAEVRSRQDEVLARMLREDSLARPRLARALFNVACHFSAERRVRLIRAQLEVDPRFESLRKLSLEPSSMSWSGSKVPVLQQRVEFWRILRGELHGLEFLEHRAFVEERLRHAETSVAAARREEFLED